MPCHAKPRYPRACNDAADSRHQYHKSTVESIRVERTSVYATAYDLSAPAAVLSSHDLKRVCEREAVQAPAYHPEECKFIQGGLQISRCPGVGLRCCHPLHGSLPKATGGRRRPAQLTHHRNRLIPRNYGPTVAPP